MLSWWFEGDQDNENRDRRHFSHMLYEVVVQRNEPNTLGRDAGKDWTLVHGSHPEDHGDGKHGIGPLRGLAGDPIEFNDSAIVPPSR